MASATSVTKSSSAAGEGRAKEGGASTGQGQGQGQGGQQAVSATPVGGAGPCIKWHMRLAGAASHPPHPQLLLRLLLLHPPRHTAAARGRLRPPSLHPHPPSALLVTATHPTIGAECPLLSPPPPSLTAGAAPNPPTHPGTAAACGLLSRSPHAAAGHCSHTGCQGAACRGWVGLGWVAQGHGQGHEGQAGAGAG